MMILSNSAIVDAIKKKEIVITPSPLERASLDADDNPFDTTSLNLRLGLTLSVPKSDQPFTFDLRKGKLAPFLTEQFTRRPIDPEGGYTLQPNAFALASTVEHIKLPIDSGFAARVEGRSSFARCGLLVHFTAPTIHAGFEGTITLELINLGKNSITLYPNLYICQLIFEKVDGAIFEHPSQFQGQTTPEGT